MGIFWKKVFLKKHSPSEFQSNRDTFKVIPSLDRLTTGPRTSETSNKD